VARLRGKHPRGKPPVVKYIPLHSPARDTRKRKFRIANRTPVLGADPEALDQDPASLYDLYTVLGSAVFALFPPSRLARPSLCSLEPLRTSIGGTTMTTLGEAGTSPYSYNFLRARRTGFYHRVGAPTTPPVRGLDSSLCPTPNTRESSHLAYKDMSGGVRALVRPDTTIRLIVKQGAL
jgi:hypothetical protein